VKLDTALRACPALLAFALNASAFQTSTTRESVATSGSQGNNLSFEAWISADGRFVAFQSSATNLVAGDTNASPDVFVRDLQNGTTERVSVATGGAQGNNSAVAPSISTDGRFVAFAGYSSNFVAGDTNGVADIFVRDRTSGTTECISVSTGGALGGGESNLPSISADGRFVAFESYATNLVAGDSNAQPDIFIRDRLNGTTERVSVSTGGTEANDYSTDAAVSADGRFVAFRSGATNLGGGAVNFRPDIFVRDRLLGTTTCVSVGSVGGFGSGGGFYPSMSTDGRFIAYESDAGDLVANDTNFTSDIFVYDRLLGATERVSVGAGSVQANAGSGTASISADGSFVAFISFASNFDAADTNGTMDVYMRDRIAGTTERMSVSTAGVQNSSANQYPTISADGRRVVFESPASTLVAGDTNNAYDVFLRDRGPLPPTNYCTAKINSQGCLPVMSFTGAPSATNPAPFTITATNVLNQKPGLLLYGYSQASTPFQGGVLCISSPLRRITTTGSHGSPVPTVDCSGSYSIDFNLRIQSGLDPLLAPGQEVDTQYWSRDPASPAPVGLTSALSFQIGA